MLRKHISTNIRSMQHQKAGQNIQQLGLGLATLLEGAGLAFDIQNRLKFQKLIMVVLKLWSWLKMFEQGEDPYRIGR